MLKYSPNYNLEKGLEETVEWYLKNIKQFKMNKKYKIGVIGLGYVGLPLAIEFGKFFPVVGYDINKLRVNELNEGEDKTLEVDKNEIFDLIKFDLEKLFFSEKGLYLQII